MTAILILTANFNENFTFLSSSLGVNDVNERENILLTCVCLRVPKVKKFKNLLMVNSAPPGQFIELQAFSAVKQTLS